MGLRSRVSRALGQQPASPTGTTVAPPRIDPTIDPVGAADQLEADGDLLAAMQVLIDSNRRASNGAVERRLVLARHRAFEAVTDQTGRAEWPPEVADLTPGHVGIPEVDRDDLDVDVLASAVVHHGALLVRNVLDHGAVDHMRDVIRETFVRFDAAEAGETPLSAAAPFYVPFEPEGAHHHKHETMARGWVREAGGVSSADSPRGLWELTKCLEHTGLRTVITEYFGERPAISAKKSVLRQVPTDIWLTDWHQDGAFLGQGIRSLNLWVALTRCGGDTSVPGMDIVPRRMDTVIPPGAEGAIFNWSASADLVAPYLVDTPLVRPEFAPGDALLFDEMLVHRTAIPDEPISEPRYAIESWFFAPSHYPEKEVPLVF